MGILRVGRVDVVRLTFRILGGSWAFNWEEPSMEGGDQYQSKGKFLTNFQRHGSIRTSLKIRQKGHWSI